MELTLPNTYTSKDLAGVDGFLETETGRQKSEKWSKAETLTDYISKGGYALSGFVFLIFWIVDGFGSGLILGIIFLVIALIVRWIFRKIENTARNGYFNSRWDYTEAMADKISSVINSSYYRLYDGTIFFFSDEVCGLANVETGNLDVVTTDDIKKVDLREVNLGSQTTQESAHSGHYSSFTDSYKGKTTTTSTTTNYFAWRLDVYTRYNALSNFTIDFGEDEEWAKKAFGLLQK
ncbi:MAG: hypothetical protein K9J16_10580 [Melioribacteraceae bacterium]|nr:hypothetical protein [Melioribacteraceae bacterium]MCF8354485.1 hypothetical protein [Melioribacteraceae bacterium]MCF8394095.1 hypothetical protein [Melioribacteraceae bacterium]MCF8419853.1 hypothetical protein [Melioribacteraceae bacterium]